MSGRAEERVQDIPVLRFRVGDMSPAEAAENAEGEANGNAEGNKALTAPWKRERLGAIGFPYNGLSGKSKSDFGHGFGRYVTYMNIFSHPIADPVQCDAIEIDKGQNEVKDGDVFFTTSSETPEDVGMSSVWIGDGENTYLNSFCFGYRPKPGNVSVFLAYLFRANGFRRAISFLAQGISRYNISKTKVMDIEIPLPDVLEQQKLGAFFRSLDVLIDWREKALGKLESLKKAMLQKMFPHGDAKTPELRFKGFEGKWEEKRLGEVCMRFDYGLNVAAREYDGRNKYIRITDIDDSNGRYSRADLSSPSGDLECFQSSVVMPGDILFARTGASVGKTYLYREEDGHVFFAGFLIRAHVQSDCDAEFVFQTTFTDRYRRFVELISQRSGQPGINAEEYKSCSFMCPSLPEQQKIGAYFRSLDALLAARRDEVAKLRDLKKALLERMFV